MPLTLTVSSVMAETSAMLFCVSPLMPPTDLAHPVGEPQEEGQDGQATAASAAIDSQAMATSVTITLMGC